MAVVNVTKTEGKLKSWEESFTVPLVTTRQIEKQLGNEIAANKNRLRALVGASYRDLLETAERIVTLDGQMQQTVTLLGETSLQCSLKIVNQKATALAESHQQQTRSKSAEYQLLAQISLLNRCAQCLPRLSRRKGFLLTGAKVLALSRLLNKSISQGQVVPPVLDTIRVQLTSERKRLLAKVDIALTDPASGFQQLADAICAFCIATSSSSKDGIRHFQDLRQAEIRRVLGSSEQEPLNVLRAFKYYTLSLQLTKRLLGTRLSDIFRDLRSQPILQSPDITALSDLSLESVQKFMPNEILTFVPWINQQQANEELLAPILNQWSKGAFVDLCDGLAHATGENQSLAEILSFRAEMLELWLPISVSTPVHSRDGIFERLRSIFNYRIQNLIRRETESLQNLAVEISKALQKDDVNSLVENRPLWDHDFIRAPLGSGSISFKKTLTDRHLGRAKTTKRSLRSLLRWAENISQSLEVFRQLRKRRWIDIIEDDEDDDQRADSIEKILQIEDPSIYEKQQQSALIATVHEFQSTIKALCEGTTQTSPNHQVIFLLRTIRSIYYSLSISLPTQKLDLTLLTSRVPHIHSLLASNIYQTLTNSSKPLIEFKRRQTYPGRLKGLGLLWTGSPSLPAQPSPEIFRLLRDLTAVMEDAGTDLWCSEAVDAVKRCVGDGIVEMGFFGPRSRGYIRGNGDGKKETESSIPAGDAKQSYDKEAKDEGKRTILIQTYFDVLFLNHAFRPSRKSEVDEDADADDTSTCHKSCLDEMAQSVRQDYHSSYPDEFAEAIHIVYERSQGYWKRTGLLFGLLS